MILRWPGKVPAGKVENGIVSGLDWFPTFVAAAGNPNIVDELKKGKQLGDRTYKVHLDGYNQTDLITGKGPSKRHEIFYFTESTLRAVRIDDFKYRFTDQPQRLAGRHGQGRLADPHQPPPRSLRAHRHAQRRQRSLAFYNWFAYEFWRFVFVQQEVAKVAQTAIEFPPMQKGASFNLEAVKAQIEKAIGVTHRPVNAHPSAVVAWRGAQPLDRGQPCWPLLGGDRSGSGRGRCQDRSDRPARAISVRDNRRSSPPSADARFDRSR